MSLLSFLLPRYPSGFAQFWRTPIGGAITFRHANVVNENVVATNATLDFLCLHCFSTPLEIKRAEDRVRVRIWY